MGRLFNLPVSSSNSKGGVMAQEKELGIGDIAPDFELCDAEGVKHKLSSFRGRQVLLSFFRYAACPVCQYSLERARQQAEMLARSGIVTICIFNSDPQPIAKLVSPKISNETLVLSDKTGWVYSLYQVKKGTTAQIVNQQMRGFQTIRPYMNMFDIFKDAGNDKSIKNQLPADFMINGEGEIIDFLRAKTILDFMSFERIEASIPEDKRCKCNAKNCLSGRCRMEYAEIKRSAEEMLFVG